MMRMREGFLGEGEEYGLVFLSANGVWEMPWFLCGGMMGYRQVAGIGEVVRAGALGPEKAMARTMARTMAGCLRPGGGYASVLIV